MTRKGIQLSRNLTVDQEFFQFLINSNTLIGSVITNLEFPSEVNFLAPTDDYDKISFIPTTKIKDDYFFDPFLKSNGRVSMKVGRFVNKLISEDVFNKMGLKKTDIVDFVNAYKSWFDKSKFILKVVEGEEIRKWYSEENYYAPNGNTVGTLWNSCMRYQKRLKFLDMYTKNPNCKMLVMLQEVDDELLVRARALLWDNVEVTKDYSSSLPTNIKVMDRIYYVFDSDVSTFKKWASDNDYIPKFEQNAKSHQFFDIKGEVVRLRCKINLDYWKLNYYPYLDTFPFFNYGEGMISNDEFTSSWDYKLIQANGDLEPQPQEEESQDDW